MKDFRRERRNRIKEKVVIFGAQMELRAMSMPGQHSSLSSSPSRLRKFFSSLQRNNKNMLLCWPWWCRRVVPTLQRLKSEDVSSRLCLKNPKAGKSSVVEPLTTS